MPDEYEWSSYNEYISESKQSLTDTSLALDMLSPENSEAIGIFRELHKIDDAIDFDITNTKKLTSAQIHRKIEKISGMTPEKISQLQRAERNQILKELRTAGLTIGQLERATGITRGIITKAK